MSHTFLSIDLSLIKANVRSNQHSFGLLSNDGSRALIDGYNAAGELVTEACFKQWIKLPDHAEAEQNLIISTAIEYTYDEYIIEHNDVNSIWYAEPEVLD
tara:strand:+ start:488 stop:787 length:300 start_codon:yes stop_codon:yes gene_type:complete